MEPGQYKAPLALAALLLIPKVNHALFGPLTAADRSTVTSELRGTLLQAAVALMVFREPVSWRALYAVLPSLFLRYLHSMVGSRLEGPKLSRTQTAMLLATLHALDIAWAHHWAAHVAAAGGTSPLALAFVADIGILWGTLIMHTGNFVYPGRRIERYFVQAYSYGVRLLVYVTMFWLMATHWYLPVHIAKDSWSMLRLLVRHCARWIQYRRAFRDYNIKATNASGVCPICFESSGELEVELSCGHDMHFDCVYRWLEVSAVCPLCRTSALAPAICGIESFLEEPCAGQDRSEPSMDPHMDHTTPL